MRNESSDVLRGTIELLILRTVAIQPMHGWGISQVLRQLSDGVLDVNQGSLYPALQRLEQRDWLDGEWRASENNRRARYYKITAKGRRAIGQEIESWRTFVSAVERILRTAPALSLMIVALSRPHHAQAQALVPSAVASRGLAIRSDTLDFFAGDKERGQFQGYYAYSVARSTIAGRPGYLVIMNHKSPGPGNHFQSDTLAVDAATLSPVWHRYHAWDDSAVVSFDGRHATGWSLRNGQRLKIDLKLSDAAFDATLARWIVPPLPLAVGSQGTIATFSIWSNAEQSATFSVTGSEVLKIGGRNVDTWVVKWSTGVSRWLAKDTGEIVQQGSPRTQGVPAFWEIKR